jgi:hypothetical protein
MSDWFTRVNEEKNSNKDTTCKIDKKHKRGRRSVILERDTKNVYRRAFSETQLLDLIGINQFKDQHQYNFITAGDVDAISYLKIIMRQQNLEHLLFSTWCMAADDIMQFEEWLEDGKIKKLDAYLGEIFPKSYPYEWQKINEIFEKYKCGKIAVFRNHSKIFAGFGDKFYFGIQTSANINTNPRTENGCITIDKKMYEFYNNYYSGIKSFEK